ncbi:MFS transporter [Pseudomonas sp. TH05]|uniref:MFS transporter n=1 Tax=unclassified Pseudomonas TaxID=196821 RepID=UPI001912ED38|nr:MULTISPECIES: MFS transporter [unclassified Pseudomonas]MBK5542549.1 MFS transporter [Pseudomonas sp. TH07]MBK5554470.1 MFS transporter [Pseudomonas sp. TH05]
MNRAVFFGNKVLLTAFVLAMLGWGIGFYGPPIFMYAVIQRSGWSLSLCSAAVTVHFLAGTLVVANLPRLYRRFGLPRVTCLGTLLLALGLLGWALAREPYQLFIGALLSGLGWVTLGAAAINAIIAPWFVRKRPAALAMAYNGASLGGVIFSSAWVYLINRLGFAMAALLVGTLALVTVASVARRVLNKSPALLGQHPDGLEPQPTPTAPTTPSTDAPVSLWRNRHFLTLGAAMALGLVAQIGLIAHLFRVLVPRFGEQQAGLAMGLATLSAIAGRTLVGWLMPPGANRRHIACLSYGVQLTGCIALVLAGAHDSLIWLGVLLFGAGIGNATSLPPLIAQAEFSSQHSQRVVALIVAFAQGCYAFAPALFGALLAMPQSAGSSSGLFIGAGLIQVLAMGVMAWGGRSSSRQGERTATHA